MTQFGSILGCTRNDIPKLKDNTLFLAGYERSIDVLYDAAYFGLTDYIKGVSESIILG
jgi:DNA-directed RNA polymerase III subunit RPC1